LRAGEILSPDRLERGDAGSSALRDMQGRSANLSMRGDPGRNPRAPSPRSRPCKDGHPRTRVAGACRAWFDVSATPLTPGPSRREREIGNGLPGQCGRGMRQADSHGERTDDRADAYRCRLHDRHNDGRNPCSLRAAARYRIAGTKPCGSARRGMLKVCTRIYRNDSDGRSSRLALMALGTGISDAAPGIEARQGRGAARRLGSREPGARACPRGRQT
jgi:hypothetical protein